MSAATLGERGVYCESNPSHSCWSQHVHMPTVSTNYIFPQLSILVCMLELLELANHSGQFHCACLVGANKQKKGHERMSGTSKQPGGDCELVHPVLRV